jgi:hypothetical protein
LAPLASADPSDPLNPIVASEITSMNFLFGATPPWRGSRPLPSRCQQAASTSSIRTT